LTKVLAAALALRETVSHKHVCRRTGNDFLSNKVISRFHPCLLVRLSPANSALTRFANAATCAALPSRLNDFSFLFFSPSAFLPPFAL
jgi:hypothetical protein